MIIRKILCIFYIFLLTGCLALPLRISYYAPQGPGNIEGMGCYTVGFKDIITIEIQNNVKLRVWAGEEGQSSEQTITLNMDLIIPEGNTVQVLSPEIQIASEAFSELTTLKIYQITSSGPRYFKPTDILPGGTRTDVFFGFKKMVYHDWFSFWLGEHSWGSTPLPAVDNFTLIIPDLLINNEEFSVHPITFERQKKWGLVLFPGCP